jgi:type II secretory pathway pseudopilin PulG
MDKSRISRSAFSMVEILFAIIALGVLLAPLFSVFRQGSTGTIRNRNDILAQQHASNLLAYVYSLPYGHSFLDEGTREVNELKITAGAVELSLDMEEELFRRTIEVKEYKPGDWHFSYKLVTVRVNWKNSSEIPGEIKIAGLVSR